MGLVQLVCQTHSTNTVQTFYVRLQFSSNIATVSAAYNLGFADAPFSKHVFRRKLKTGGFCREVPVMSRLSKRAANL